jgi:acetolactate synthase-1/2/3 large subunit
MARERLDVTTVVFANRSYAILNIELMRVGAEAGQGALSMLDIGNPALDWVSLAVGMGVDGVRVEDLEAFDAEFAAAMATPGPRLIEAVL